MQKTVKSELNQLYRWLQKNNYPDWFQVLCHNCNSAKGEFEICTHEK